MAGMDDGRFGVDHFPGDGLFFFLFHGLSSFVQVVNRMFPVKGSYHRKIIPETEQENSDT